MGGAPSRSPGLAVGGRPGPVLGEPPGGGGARDERVSRKLGPRGGGGRRFSCS